MSKDDIDSYFFRRCQVSGIESRCIVRVPWLHVETVLDTCRSEQSSDRADAGHKFDLMCYCGKLDPLTELQLLYSYCASLYGSELMYLSCCTVSSLRVSWLRGMKYVRKLLIF